MNTYNEAKAARDSAEERLSIAYLALGSYPKGVMGLTPDAVKATPEWQKDKAEYDVAFATLRAINGVIVKKFRKEYHSERNTRMTTRRTVRCRIESEQTLNGDDGTP